MLEERRAGFAIGETIRALAEPRASTAWAVYGPGAMVDVPLAQGAADLLLTASLGLMSYTEYGDLEAMGLCGGDL
jgi:hypothetical protein